MASGILGKALAGAAGAVKDTSMEMIRAEIMAQRDARLNEYARGMQTEVVQPFQAGESALSREQQANESAATREAAAAKHSETFGETRRHNLATEESQRISAEARRTAAQTKAAAGEKGGITQKDGIVHVLQPRYGGKFEGGMWFPDEKNRDVGLRAMQLYEQFTSGPNKLAPVEGAKRAAEQAEREQAMGTLPIGKGAPATAPGASEDATPPGKSKSFKYLWGD